MTKVEELKKYSNPREAQRKAYRYLGKKYGKIYPSSRREKKYMVQKPHTKKWVHFGQMGYEDFTKHKNLTRRKNYLNRSRKIKGHWKEDKFSANSLAIHVLW
jgi:hypothetical protein